MCSPPPPSALFLAAKFGCPVGWLLSRWVGANGNEVLREVSELTAFLAITDYWLWVL